MSRLGRLWKVVTHPRELRLALSGLATRLVGDDAMGGLAPDEAEALARWVRGAAPDVFVEIGTLFGFTALTSRCRLSSSGASRSTWITHIATSEQITSSVPGLRMSLTG